MKEMIRLFVGYDPRESACYHVFCESVIQNTSIPVSITPLHSPMLRDFDGQQDGTNAFIYSRYLIPYLMDYDGWALFMDGDMVCNRDLAELWGLRDEGMAIQCVQHDYKTKRRLKYIGSPLQSENVDYDRKNWSSVMLINCGHPSNKIVTRLLCEEAGPRFMHRFEWLNDEEIGELPKEWNWLDTEYPENSGAALHHHTLGCPGFAAYTSCDSAQGWHKYFLDAIYLAGEKPEMMVARALTRLDGNGNHHQLRDTENSGNGLSRTL